MRTATIRSRTALYPLGFRSGQTFQAIKAIGFTLYLIQRTETLPIEHERKLVSRTYSDRLKNQPNIRAPGFVIPTHS